MEDANWAGTPKPVSKKQLQEASLLSLSLFLFNVLYSVSFFVYFSFYRIDTTNSSDQIHLLINNLNISKLVQLNLQNSRRDNRLSLYMLCTSLFCLFTHTLSSSLQPFSTTCTIVTENECTAFVILQTVIFLYRISVGGLPYLLMTSVKPHRLNQLCS